MLRIPLIRTVIPAKTALSLGESFEDVNILRPIPVKTPYMTQFTLLMEEENIVSLLAN